MALNGFGGIFRKDAPSRSPTTGDALVYAIGDIHGCYDQLLRLLCEIKIDLQTEGFRAIPTLVFCGDYIDRGPKSAQVVEALVCLQRRSNMIVRVLKGNHEQALLNYLDLPLDGRPWLGFGGAETLTAYGVRPPNDDADPEALLAARDALLQKMPSSHLRLFQRLELTLTVGDYTFVHAGIRPGVPLAKQAEQDMLWIREEFLGHAGLFEKVIVHGHTWSSDQVEIRDNRIAIDTGAYSTGVLSAVRLYRGGAKIICTSANRAAARTTAKVPDPLDARP